VESRKPRITYGNKVRDVIVEFLSLLLFASSIVRYAFDAALEKAIVKAVLVGQRFPAILVDVDLSQLVSATANAVEFGLRCP
jgi:hypothetical protein